MRKYVFKKKWKRVLAAVVDAAGFVFFAPFKIFRKKSRGVNKILVMRIDHIGDSVQALPFIEKLRGKYPRARITLVIKKQSFFIFENNPCIDEIITVGNNWFDSGGKTNLRSLREAFLCIRKNRPDIAFELRGDIRNLLFLYFAGARNIAGYGCAGGAFLLDEEKPYFREEHEINKNLRLIGEREAGPVKINFNIKNFSASARDTLKKHSVKEGDIPIMMHPFARTPSRRWGNYRYKALIKKILREHKNAKIFITGGPDDIKERKDFEVSGRVFDIIGKDIPSTFELMKNCRMFIGSDSSLQYFAAYSGVKTCVIYGHVLNNKRWRPMTAEGFFRGISIPVECGPCELEECANKKGHLCMNVIKVDYVYENIKEWF